jgi:hypothetical protein
MKNKKKFSLPKSLGTLKILKSPFLVKNLLIAIVAVGIYALFVTSVEALVKNTSETQNKNAILKSYVLGTVHGKTKEFRIEIYLRKIISRILEFVSISKIHGQQQLFLPFYCKL